MRQDDTSAEHQVANCSDCANGVYGLVFWCVVLMLIASVVLAGIPFTLGLVAALVVIGLFCAV